jgi:hypothetical protein
LYALHITLVILMLLAAILSASSTRERFALPSSVRVLMPEHGMPYPPWYTKQQNYSVLPWCPS